jgi:hypothetical protein
MANNDKNRKSEIQERFDEADNNGRFAGNDEDSMKAKQNALKAGAKDTTGYDSGEKQNTGTGNSDTSDERTDREAHRDPNQSHDYKGDAQNVSDDFSRPLDNQDDLQHARNKAHSGSKNKDDR